MASILDEIEYEDLTGISLAESQLGRFNAILAVAVAQLEELLGWPLSPNSWDDQYAEIGKSKSNLSCPNADAELDPPDVPIGTTRLFTLYPGEPYMAIDPATEIHSVKWIRGNITCIDYDESAYIPKYGNGNPSTVRWIGIRKLMCDCIRMKEPREFAVDADWAYQDEDGEPDLPIELKAVLVDMIKEELDPRSDIKSESVVSHSYTKFDRVLAEDKHANTIKKFAGPHGTASRRLA